MNWQTLKNLIEAAGVQPDTEIFYIEIENAINDADIIVCMLPGCNGFYVREAGKEEQGLLK